MLLHVKRFVGEEKSHFVAAVQGYGMTETTFSAVTSPPNYELPPGSIGVVLPNTEAKVCICKLEEALKVYKPPLRQLIQMGNFCRNGLFPGVSVQGVYSRGFTS